jgi:NAD(P)-dependent dehydrogenase (short-subunit alcohol dehydrogenase family)
MPTAPPPGTSPPTPTSALAGALPRRFEGAAVLVTAGGDGIGAAVARRFAAEGASVMVADVDMAAAEKVAAELAESGSAAAAVQCDVSAAADAARAVAAADDAFGRLDVLINNAGIGPTGNVYSHTEDEWDRVFDVNVKGGFLMSKHAVPLIRRSGGGSILFTASVGGHRGTMRFLAYSASKAAVLQMMRCMALDHGRHGIRVNAVCPGPCRTPRWAEMAPPFEAEFARGTPVDERISTPEEQAAAFAFLASSDAAFITGEMITVDGGLSTGQLHEFMVEP